MSMFLDADELAALTGRRVKSKQIDALRAMSVPFRINALGKPVVTAAAVEGRKEAPQPKTWTPPA